MKLKKLIYFAETPIKTEFSDGVWGGLHGIAQISERILSNKKRHKEKTEFNGSHNFEIVKRSIIVTFISFAWIFFRASTLKEAFIYIWRIFTTWDFSVLFTQKIYNLGLNVVEFNILQMAVMVLIVTDLFKYLFGKKEFEFTNAQDKIFRWVFNVLLIAIIFEFGVYGADQVDQAFLYFQF